MTESKKNTGISLLSRRAVMENARFRLFADRIMDCNGNEVQDFLVVVPQVQHAQLVSGVVVIPIQGDQILFLNNDRHPVSQRVLEAVRGFIDANEEPAVAALRELSEETGLACSPDKLRFLGFILPEPGVLSARVALFAATECHEGGKRLDDEIGNDEWLWRHKDEVRRMLVDGRIEDASTCVALHRYFLTLDS
jgi:ADP-ribose pyrophosphatase